MSLDRIETAISRHGPALERWPAEARAEAEALMAAEPALRRALDEAALVEAALAEAARAHEPAPAALLERIIADAGEVAAARAPAARPAARRSGFRWRVPDFFRPALACAASALIGLWLGQSAMVAQAAQGLIAEEPAAYSETMGAPELAMGYGDLSEAWE